MLLNQFKLKQKELFSNKHINIKQVFCADFKMCLASISSGIKSKFITSAHIKSMHITSLCIKLIKIRCTRPQNRVPVQSRTFRCRHLSLEKIRCQDGQLQCPSSSNGEDMNLLFYLYFCLAFKHVVQSSI